MHQIQLDIKFLKTFISVIILKWEYLKFIVRMKDLVNVKRNDISLKKEYQYLLLVLVEKDEISYLLPTPTYR